MAPAQKVTVGVGEWGRQLSSLGTSTCPVLQGQRPDPPSPAPHLVSLPGSWLDQPARCPAGPSQCLGGQWGQLTPWSRAWWVGGIALTTPLCFLLSRLWEPPLVGEVE